MPNWTLSSVTTCPMCDERVKTQHIQSHILETCGVFGQCQVIKEYQVDKGLYMMVVASPSQGDRVYVLFMDELHDPIEVVDCSLDYGKGTPLGTIDRMIHSHNNALYTLNAIRDAVVRGYTTHDMEVES